MLSGNRVGYVIPEWPGQTHIWMWREICHMREFGAEIHVFSTRLPSERDSARHSFAEQAKNETTYLWPMPLLRLIGAVLSEMLLHPIGFFRCVQLAFRLPIDAKPRWKKLLPLIAPACYMARQVRRLKLRHMHSHVPANSTILCMMVKRLTGVPFSQIVNANLEWWGGAMREKFRDAAFTTFCTRWMVEQMKRDYPDIDPEAYGLCRVAVDVRRWVLPAARKPDKTLKILTVSRLVPSKGQDDLLKAIGLLRERGHDVTLRIGGDGPERAKLEKLAKDLNIAERVTFLGSISEEQYFAEMIAADAFVLASHGEPMGVVYMEALSTQTPAVGTAAGGVGEIITSGEDGLLVPPFDPKAVADALEQLIEHPELREKFGKAGREKVLKDFDSRFWAAELYRRIFGTAPSANAQATGASNPAAVSFASNQNVREQPMDGQGARAALIQ
jgi:glycosyltransferase involved in cell wall biosynthesis